MSLTFDEACNLINELPKFTTKHSMEESRTFLHELGNPEEGQRIIHVAGTNGKGSVCVYMESILLQAGFKTGCFVSPHLVDIRERIRINGEMCTEEEFSTACETVLEVSKRLFYPTFFEYLFFVGLLIYKMRNVDVLILETGLGGRLDATNLPEKKELCVIPSIGMDHMQYLGNTVEEIAREKAGIFRKNVPAIFWEDKKADRCGCEGAEKVLYEAAVQTGADAYVLSEDTISEINVRNTGIDFCLRNKYDKYICLTVPSKALYQVKNVALAVSALQIWDENDIISDEAYVKGVANVRWEGRMEEILPNVFLDGAHNVPAIKELLETVARDKKDRRMLIFGCMSDKDYRTEADMIIKSGLFERIVTIEIGTRSEYALKLSEIFAASANACGGKIPQIECISDPKPDNIASAICMAKDYTVYDDAIVYIAGSLYVVGEIRGYLHD